MPFYDHECKECGHIWEDFYSMVTDPPEECPECGFKSKTHRSAVNNISIRVTLKGNELKAKIKEDGQKLRRRAAKDENLRANLMGEEKHHKEELSNKEFGDNLKQL